mmetsp:Transcript_9909/g.18631  ORF Transcript_9909/g.18631 Transcript_9909/m.18631 type:complete len:250 (+) Transcript_9909:1163-1912(+)
MSKLREEAPWRSAASSSRLRRRHRRAHWLRGGRVAAPCKQLPCAGCARREREGCAARCAPPAAAPRAWEQSGTLGSTWPQTQPRQGGTGAPPGGSKGRFRLPAARRGSGPGGARTPSWPQAASLPIGSQTHAASPQTRACLCGRASPCACPGSRVPAPPPSAPSSARGPDPWRGPGWAQTTPGGCWPPSAAGATSWRRRAAAATSGLGTPSREPASHPAPRARSALGGRARSPRSTASLPQAPCSVSCS